MTVVTEGRDGLVKLGVLGRSFIGRLYGRYPPLRRILKGIQGLFRVMYGRAASSGYARIPKKQYEHLL